MLLMRENNIRGEICHAIYWYVKVNKKFMKNYHENKESSNLNPNHPGLFLKLDNLGLVEEAPSINPEPVNP